ncbi:MAG: Fic family protein, partial [Lachnospiraceae bacterium]|nr:Fic family protein [Lachnospiraceae bacterium]
PIITSKVADVENDIDRLLEDYNSIDEIVIEDIIDFHYRFEKIHPFGDGNGRVGRMIMFKECLKNGIMPFIISNDDRSYYLRGLNEYKRDTAWLVDTILHAQDIYTYTVEKYLSISNENDTGFTR